MMKQKLFTLFLTLATGVGTMFAASGTCGDHLTWDLDLNNRVLTISGKGAMTNYSYSKYAPWYNIRSYITSIVIGNDVTSIGNYAFYGCTGLTSITIPNDVTSIGYYAFEGCTGLTSVTIPNSVTSIGEGAFSGCSGLTSPVYNAHIFAFLPTSYTGAYTIPDGIESIGNFAFGYCDGLTSITIPNSVTSIGKSAFSGCESLTYVAIPNSVTSIGDYAFSHCKNLPFIDISNNVKSIGEYAFQYCISLTSIEIPNSVTSIGDGVFSHCTGLTSVTIPNSVTSIGDGVFSHCTGLTSVTIPNSVTSIGDDAFRNCTSLISIEIPNSVTSIGSSAFDNCTGLTSPIYNAHVFAYMPTSYIGAYTIPDGIKSIAGSAFSGCTGLTSITIPISVTSIGGGAFSGCTGLTSITIPNSVTSIGGGAFSGCTGLTSITIPNSVTSIGDWAFNYCTGLTSIEIPNSITSIGNQAFQDCRFLTSIEIPNSVISIGDLTFQRCFGLTTVTIGNSVTSIGGGLFLYCTGLTSITCKAVTPPVCGEGAFCEVDKSIPLYVPAESVNAYKSADQWKDFTNVQLICHASGTCGVQGDNLTWELSCDGVLTISGTGEMTNFQYNGSPWYSYRSSIAEVSMDNSVTSIGNYAFYGCSGLTSVTIPNSVTSIGNSAFSGCTGLTTINIPNSVTSIGEAAFYNCSGLTSVTIPNSVTSIGGGAFMYCSKLIVIYMKATTPPAISSDSFEDIHSDAVVYIPYGSLNAYKTAQNWSKYNIHVINPSHSSSLSGATSVTITLGDNDEAKHIVSCGMEGGEEFAGNIIEYIGLEPESQYADVPFYVKTKEGDHDILSCSFSTSALQLTTQESKPVSSNTAILLAETNMAEIETSCGFEWKRNDAPEDMTPSKVFCPVANGLMAGRLKGLKEEVYYKYRAFYQSAAGNMYYGDWKYIFTGDVAVEFDPILYTYAAIAVKENEATLKGYALAGSEDFTEQGFEYWAESRANNAPRRTAASIGEHKTVTASGISMKATLTDLDEGTVYRYRSYAKIGSQTLYGSEMTLTTLGEYHDSQAIEDIHVDAPQATKILRDGQVLIQKGDKLFDLRGQEVK